MKESRRFSEAEKGHNKPGQGESASLAGDKFSCLRLRLLCSLRIKCLQAFLHTGIVDAQKLVLSGGHVDKVGLALCTFLIKELVHWFICRGLFQVCTDNLVERFAQIW